MEKYSEMNNDTYMCRICLEEQDTLDDLISPCRCSGSSKYVHLECLQKWRNASRGERGENICMECRTEYIIRKTHDRETLIDTKNPTLFQLIYYIPGIISLIVYLNDDKGNFITFLDGGEVYQTKHCVTFYDRYNKKNYTSCYPLNVRGYIDDMDGIIYPFYLSILLSIYNFLLISTFSLYQIKKLKKPILFFKKYKLYNLFLHQLISLRMFIFYYSLRFTYPFVCIMLSLISIPIEFCNTQRSYVRYKTVINNINNDITDDDTILNWSDNYIHGEGYDMVEINEHTESSDEDN